MARQKRVFSPEFREDAVRWAGRAFSAAVYASCTVEGGAGGMA